MIGQTLRAGTHASSPPRRLKLPKGALSTIPPRSKAPEGLRVLVAELVEPILVL